MIKFSTQYKAVKSRLYRLPQKVDQIIITQIKKDANGIIEDFQNGIRKNNFRLERLKEKTVEEKRRKGYSKPRTPLYGLGDLDANTLINALELVKIGDRRWVIKGRDTKHHKANLSLDSLLNIHEKGATIIRGGTTIRIPPRPVLMKSFQRYLRRKKKGEIADEVKKRMLQFINEGRLRA